MGNTGSFSFGPISGSGPDPINNAGDMINADIQHQWAAQATANQQDYETQMSNTAYQRATADMEAAGINPLMAVSNGGASTPSVAAQVVPNLMGGAGQAHSAAGFDPNYLKQGKLLDKQGEVLDSQNQKNLAEAANTIAALPGLNSASQAKSVELQLDRINLLNNQNLQTARDQNPGLYSAKAFTDTFGQGAPGVAAGWGAFAGSTAAASPAPTPTATPSSSPSIPDGGYGPTSNFTDPYGGGE
jgi:hypothetical protein|nr:MAG: DNA pilot protein [Microviridae sp.]